MRRDLPCCSPIILFGFAHHLECLSEMQASPVALGVRIPTVALHLTELFDTTVEQLYSIFTVKEVSNTLNYSTKCGLRRHHKEQRQFLIEARILVMKIQGYLLSNFRGQ